MDEDSLLYRRCLKLNAVSQTVMRRLAQRTEETPDFLWLTVQSTRQPADCAGAGWDMVCSHLIQDYYHLLLTLDCSTGFGFRYLNQALWFINQLPEVVTIGGMESFPVLAPMDPQMGVSE